jgi:hypothetical protein
VPKRHKAAAPFPSALRRGVLFRFAAHHTRLYEKQEAEFWRKHMSYSEKLKKASQYCEHNKGYRVVADRLAHTLLLVKDGTSTVKTAVLG